MKSQTKRSGRNRFTDRVGRTPGRAWRLLPRPVIHGGKEFPLLTWRGTWSIVPVDGGFRLMRHIGRYKGPLFATVKDAKDWLQNALRYRWRGPERLKRRVAVSDEEFRERMAKKGIEI